MHANPDATVRERLAACRRGRAAPPATTDSIPSVCRWSTSTQSAIGQRETENGKPIDATGTLPGNIALNGSADLKATLARGAISSSKAHRKGAHLRDRCGVEPFDRSAIRQIAQCTSACAHEDRFTALIESIALSETFRTCRGRKPTHE